MKLITLILLSITLFTSCKSVQEKIQADIWLADKEGYIYRVITCDKKAEEKGLCTIPGEYEERISSTHEAIENYMSMHKDDVAKWSELLTKKCKGGE